MPIPVFAVEDSPPTLKALRKLLSGSEQVALVGAATTGEDALREVPAARPRVVLMDLELPGASGVETTRKLKAASDVEVLVLTSFEDEQHVFDAMRGGASGYVVKGAQAGKLIEAIVEVEAGGTVIEPRLARRFWQYFKGVQEPRKPEVPQLTDLEREILAMIARGLSNEEAGRIVSLDRRSVRTQLGHIYAKLGVRSHVEAVVKGLKLGIIEI
ncbi:MAG: response regulator [Myxococcales bacterium]|nr:response regulator transcription factor [Myxococcales bacterium]